MKLILLIKLNIENSIFTIQTRVDLTKDYFAQETCGYQTRKHPIVHYVFSYWHRISPSALDLTSPAKKYKYGHR